MCITVKPLKNIMYICTKIYDSINNYAHHGKKKPHHEVEDGYISVKTL